MHSHLLISRSDMQCFSHEDGCFAAGSEVQEQPVWIVTYYQCRNYQHVNYQHVNYQHVNYQHVNYQHVTYQHVNYQHRNY